MSILSTDFSRRDRKSSLRARRAHACELEREALDHVDRILTFKQWCRVNSFSVSTGRRILKSGKGPAVIQLTERRIGIRESDNRAWQETLVR